MYGGPKAFYREAVKDTSIGGRESGILLDESKE
jgi:hypothetical protein